MTEYEHRAGVIPAHRRRLVLWMLVVVAVTTAGGSALVNLLTGSHVQWIWLIVGPLFVVLLMGLYLWVRLSD